MRDRDIAKALKSCLFYKSHSFVPRICECCAFSNQNIMFIVISIDVKFKNTYQ